MKREHLYSLLSAFVFALALILLSTPPTSSQSPAPIPIPVALSPVQRDTPIELVALTLDAQISESGGRTVLTGNSTFKLHNTDTLTDVQAAVGFPAWAGDPYTFDPAKLDAFSVTLDGRRIPLSAGRADLKIGGAVRPVDWYTFTLPLAADEKKTVRFDFQQNLGDAAVPRFAYGLVTATGWKGSVGSARLTINFPDSTLPEQIVSYDPANISFDGETLTWRFTKREPPVNPTLTFLRPSLWNELLTRRRAVQQNPKDANAHTLLGGLLNQLSQAESARRDSYSAQAIAELETATRLEPGQRGARQALAALYEARAGSAAGPRQIPYVLLAAAQWETLAPTDGGARKQLAEDYFYLGLDAQTRGAFTEALGYFDKAQTLSPGGAGPLYTPERAAGQRRLLNIAWARALLEKDDFAGATAQARAALGDAFMSSFYAPPFYLGRAQVNMFPRSRAMQFRLVPFSGNGEQLQDSLNSVAKPLLVAGAEVTIQAVDSTDVAFGITVPFSTQADLADKLRTLSGALPDRAEWSIVRAVLSPDALEWDAAGGLIADASHYREEVDLSPGCGILEGQLGTLEQAIKPLERAPATDTEAQLKRALLTNARSGWQRALAQGRVSYRAATDEMTVDACAARTVSFSAAPLRVEFIIVLLLGGTVVAGALAYGIWRIGKTRRRRRTIRERAG